MSVRDTEILNPVDLRYMLIDSLRLYSSDIAFIDGHNPYRFAVNKRDFFILIKNVHESGNGRDNQDECRVQISRASSFGHAQSANADVAVLGYFPDLRIFTAWNPYLMKNRFNAKATVSLYSRFSVMEAAASDGVSTYVDTKKQSVISFKPEYLGLYLENIKNIHTLSDDELRALIAASDVLQDSDADEEVNVDGHTMYVNHRRAARDPKFRKLVYEAYGHRCAMCGIQLELIEAAHIVPFSHAHGSDEISNGVCLCALHHTAYDQSLVYFDDEFSIKINSEKIKYLEKIGRDGGYRKLQDMSFDRLVLPSSHIFQPNPANIRIANHIRGIVID